MRTVAKLERDRAALIGALRTMIDCHGGDELWWRGEGEHRYQNQIDDMRLPPPTDSVIRQQVTAECAAILHSITDEQDQLHL